MNKSIILSVSQEEALNILSSKQTALLRKRIPKDYKGWVYGYVRPKPQLAKYPYGYFIDVEKNQYVDKIGLKRSTHLIVSLNQTIPFKFKLNDYIIYERKEELNAYEPKREEDFNKCSGDMVLRKLNTSRENFKKYGNGKDLYVLKIDDLTIFDKPMQLNDFIVDFIDINTDICGKEVDWYKLPIPLSKPPKTYQYVWVKEGE